MTQTPDEVLREEIRETPEALRRVARSLGEGGPLGGALARLRASPRVLDVPIFTGMGASYHAARLAAHLLRRRGVRASAVEATELLFGITSGGGFQPHETLIYISQSGESGEVAPLFATGALPPVTVAVTNDPTSTLARSSTVVLPLEAGPEQTVATKTFISSLAVLSQLVAAAVPGVEPLDPLTTAELVRELLARDTSSAPACARHIVGASALFCVGHGAEAITARHVAMMCAEWGKVPVHYHGVGEFRHGFIEAALPGGRVILFLGEGEERRSTLTLASELVGYGVAVSVVDAGRISPFSTDGSYEGVRTNPFLRVVLDTVAWQLIAHSLPSIRGVAPGFTRIRKVCRTL